MTKTKSTTSIEETVKNLYEAMAAAVEHPQCPPSLAFQISDFVSQMSVTAEEVNHGAIEAARLRHVFPVAVSILAQNDSKYQGLSRANGGA